MSVRGSRARSLDIFPLSLLLAIAISTFRSTSWHNDKLCSVFQTSYWFFFLKFVKIAEFFTFLEVNTYDFSVLVCEYEAARERSVLSDTSLTVKACAFLFSFFFFFKVGLFWHFCRLGNNAPFQLFFRMIQMPYFHSCAKVVSAFLLLLLR